MIITQEKNKQVVESHDFDSVNCTIDAEDMRYVASLLRNNYSNPILAVVREISANALDANAEANVTRPIEIKLPTKMNPTFSVRDFGGGLSQEDVFGLYSKYGKSTKRTSNNYIGAFGIGKFAPLSYGSNFTCVSYHGGKKVSYNIFVNEDDDTKILKLHEEDSNDPTGLSIEVAVSDQDVDEFREITKNFFAFFNESEMPKFIGVDNDFIKSQEILMESKDDSWFIVKSDNHYSNHYYAHAMMGRVAYPLNPSNINFSSFVSDSNVVKQISSLASQNNLYIRFDIGQLKLHHSRETLEYNKATQKEIVKVLLKLRAEIIEIAKEKLGDSQDLWEAKVQYARVMNAIPYELRSLFDNAFEHNDIAVTSSRFQRPYQYQDELIITRYEKNEDKDASDGYRCASTKDGNIYAQPNVQLVIQDIASSHGNALRARTLFNADQDLKTIYIIHAVNERSENYLYDVVDGMQFNAISKDRLKYTSSIEKAKLQSGTKASKGETRASVPLFELDIVGKNTRHYRLSDYWLNVAEDISDLESNNSTLIYVPISNYKIVDEHETGQQSVVELDVFFKDVRSVNSLHGKDDKIKVYGVRKKDCSKLDKTIWKTWESYKLNFCKSYVKSNKKLLEKNSKVVAFENRTDEDDVNFRSIDMLFASDSFRTFFMNNLDKNHFITELMQEYSDFDAKGNLTDVRTLGRVMQYINKHDEEWVEKNVNLFDFKLFDEKCHKVITKYPLLVNIANQTYHYVDMKKDNYGKNLVDYICMCDLCA